MPFWAHVMSKTPPTSEPSGLQSSRAPTERQARTHVRQGEEAGVTVANEHEGEASRRHVVPRAVNDPTASFTPLDQSPGDPISFLFTPTLPTTPSILRRLAEQYFDNVHPLRCFAFVHKPSFMRRLDEGFGSDSNSALLHMICAHGARFYALNHSCHVHPLPANVVHMAGMEWMNAAERLIFANYGKISVSNLMATVLLYDFHFRLGNYGQALMLSGFATRMAHSLQLNLEYSDNSTSDDAGSADLLTSYKESRRRLMWACYVLDAWTGSGVDQLTLLHERDIKIQLPCDERSFLLQIPRVTEKLGGSQSSNLQSSESTLQRKTEDMGIMYYYVRLIALWKRVARYVKHLDSTQPPWLPESEFSLLHAELQAWRDNLPPSLDFNPGVVYIRLESSQLGALATLHCTYHNAMCDFYRICMPELFKLRNNFGDMQSDFVEKLQYDTLRHAQTMAMVLAETSRQGSRFLADSMLPCFAYNGTRVMLYYIARLLDLSQPDSQSIMDDTIKHVESNLAVLQMMSMIVPLAQQLYVTAGRWLRKVRTSFTRADPTAHIGPRDPSNIHDTEWAQSVPGSPSQSTPDSMLNPLSLYRLARKEVSDKGHLDKAPRPDQRGSSPTDVGSVRRPLHGDPRDTSGEASWASAPIQDLAHRPEAGLDSAVAISATPWQAPHETQGMGEAALDLGDLQNFLSWVGP
ncbi:hypothetical protein CDV31_016659 [Fusarium ambrosium]|uniref:Xylanolytic transcriptional activator regulatory domain-containing protein n=1 Tax=Fusarium ambrosium TaxID=131363 RepID=A0A428S4N6_9HYPO|nr:hypothetical protein CDV31_016659 [Fusarium ambrosium]